MAGWPGKFIIGLTGNIATGKSVVRRMLEHLGAYTIDADQLSHRATAKGSPGYQQVVDYFGRYILAADGQVDRSRLGKIVFSDPIALKSLEKIVHPLVRQAVDVLVRRSTQKIVVIEAIKLLEGELKYACDSIWVTYAPPEVQLSRLVSRRQMSEGDAWQRIVAQGSQDDKMAAADVVIQNTGSVENTWRQVAASWQLVVPAGMVVEPEPKPVPVEAGKLHVLRAKPGHSADIAAVITRLSGGSRSLQAGDIMESFGEKAYMLLLLGDRLVGVLGWQVENLVARLDDLYLEPILPLSEAAKLLLEEVAQASRQLQCEAALLFLKPDQARHKDVWNGLGYTYRTIDQLGIRAWQDAARESQPQGSHLFFNQLRQDRVLRPV
jgi:dephospho-CoA kinase